VRVLRSIGKAVAEMKCPVRVPKSMGCPAIVHGKYDASQKLAPVRYGSVKVLLDGEANPGFGCGSRSRSTPTRFRLHSP